MGLKLLIVFIVPTDLHVPKSLDKSVNVTDKNTWVLLIPIHLTKNVEGR